MAGGGLGGLESEKALDASVGCDGYQARKLDLLGKKSTEASRMWTIKSCLLVCSAGCSYPRLMMGIHGSGCWQATRSEGEGS